MSILPKQKKKCFYNSKHMMICCIMPRGVYVHQKLSEEHKKKLSVALKGKRFSEERKKRICRFWKGKHRSEETKQKISKALKGRYMGEKNPFYGKDFSEETKKKKSILLRKNWKDKAWKEKRLKQLSKSLHKKPTLPEKQFMDICKKHNLPYKYVGNGKFWIEGRNPDFIESNGKKVVVEVFGRYWHSALYSRKIPYRLTQEGTLKHYKKYGFKCIILWDNELKNEQLVLEHLKQKQIV